MTDNGKPKLALYWASSCGGCEIAVLAIHEKILDVANAFDIVFWPCVMDFKESDVAAMADGEIDVCLFNGAIRNDDNEHMAKLLRRKSKSWSLTAHARWKAACPVWRTSPTVRT